MLIHTPVSTSPLPDNDKNHCHDYNGMARSRVTAHRAVHGSVRAQTESATGTFLCVFESFVYVCVCFILSAMAPCKFSIELAVYSCLGPD